jgi:hypothetical protein
MDGPNWIHRGWHADNRTAVDTLLYGMALSYSVSTESAALHSSLCLSQKTDQC